MAFHFPGSSDTSGFPARKDAPPLGPNPLFEAVTARRAAARDILDLTISNPTAVGLAFPDDWTGLLGDRALQRYEPNPQGLPSARDAVAAYYDACEKEREEQDTDRGPTMDAADFFLTAGTSEGYSHLFRILCEPGDEILIPAPSYPLLETLAELAGLSLRTYPLLPQEAGGFVAWSVDREALTAQVTARTRIVCTVHPNNPTGSVLASGDAAWLLELADQRGLALIVDEVFADFRHDGGSTSRIQPDPEQGPLVFTLNGLSKLVGLPQLKLAWIHVAGTVADKARAKERLEWICDAFLSVGTAPQLACAELLRRRTEFQEPIRERLRTNLATLRKITAGNPKLRPLWPQGGWCVPIQIPGIGGVEDDEALAIRLVKTEGLLVQPGYFFDFEDDGTIVLSLLPEPETFREGLARLKRALT